MINSDLNVGGIYRAFIVTVGGDVRIYIPGLTSLIAGSNAPVNEDGTINKESYEDNKNSLSKPIWCLPNLEAKQHDEVHPCWVTFENGDSKRPIIMGFLGKGIKYSAGANGGSAGGSYNPGNNKYVGDGTTGNDNGDYIFKKLIEAGASIGGACAVLGNIVIESSFDPIADNGSHRGIAQWDYNHNNQSGRWYLLKKWCDNNNYSNKYNTIEAQTAYLIYDLQTEATWMSKTNNQGWNNICKDIVTEEEIKNLTDSIRLHYERCGEQGTQGRRDKAIDFWNIFKNGKIENGQYSNNNSKINNYLIDNGAGGTRKEAKEHGSGSGTQCVELPNDYIQEVFGLKNYGGFGNGKDYYIGVTNQYPNVFEKIEWQTGTILKPGDIVSMSSPSQPQYGHVVIIKAINGNKIQILDQWAGCGNVQDSEWTLDGNVLIQRNGTRRTIYGIARPK